MATRPVTEPDRLPLVSVIAALAVFVIYQGWAGQLAGRFEYPLDDVYIHMSMAESLAKGEYGVNAGESASAASSILYPVLLVPFAGTELQRLLPLAWNIVGLTLSAWLWGRILAESGARAITGFFLAALVPAAINMPGVAFDGMEHSLHAAATLAIVLGLWRYMNGGPVAWWLVAAVILAPLLRLEGLALSLATCGVMALRGQWRRGVLLGLAVVAPVVAFSGFLIFLGLSPLPSSVLVKMAMVSDGASGIEKTLATLSVNLGKPMGKILGLLIVISLLAPIVSRSLRQGPAWLLLLVTGGVGLAHLGFGQIGWMHRYELYVIAMILAALVLASGHRAVSQQGVLLGVVAVVAVASGNVYLPDIMRYFVWNPRAVSLQQVQMARFVHDFAKMPVAVNDLGHVAWASDIYVLDLWGLASEEARIIRTAPGGPPSGWAGPLAAKHDVPLAMIYEDWLLTSIGKDWVLVARLGMDRAYGSIGGYEVTFYATSPDAVPAINAALDAFAPTLPKDATLLRLETVAP